MDLVVLPLRLTHRLTSGLPPLPLGRVKLGLSPRPRREGARSATSVRNAAIETDTDTGRENHRRATSVSVRIAPSLFGPSFPFPRFPLGKSRNPARFAFFSIFFFRVPPSPRVEATDDDVHHIDAFAHEKARFFVRGGGWKGPRKAGRSTDAPEREPGTP